MPDKNISVCRVIQRRAAIGRLEAFKDFEAFAVRIKIAHMHGVAVPQVGIVQTFTIVVDGTGSVNDFVFSVAVHIGHAQVVVALTGIAAVTRSIRIKNPALRQIGTVKVVSRQHRAGVIPPGHDQTGTPTVEIGHGGQKTVYPVAVTVSPGIDTAPGRMVRHRGQFSSGSSVKNRQVFGACKYVASAVAVIGTVVCCGGRPLAQVVPQAVFGAGSRFTGNFGNTVAVQVVHHKLGIMRSGPYVDTQVDAPEFVAVQSVSVQVNIAGIARMRIVFSVCGLPFYYQIVPVVVVQVPRTHIVGSITVTYVIGGNPARRQIQC